jgi:LmbE family N-acetylglucosaminyl deacetylase
MPAPIEFQRVLVVTAHPDDVDFGAAGTIAGWTDQGIDVSYCIVTDGDAGGFDPTVPRSEIAGIRQREQTAAGAAIGVRSLRFLGYPDGRLESTLDLRKDISREIRRYQPDIVLAQSPVRNFERIYASHPDHLATAEATMCAVYPDARNPFTFTELMDEGFEPHAARQVWLMGGGTGENHVVDTTCQFDRKIAALLCHESQHQDPNGLSTRIRAWNESIATQNGLPAGRTAEIFQIIDTA